MDSRIYSSYTHEIISQQRIEEEKKQKPQAEVTIISLDINKNDNDFESYSQLSAIEKIEYIASRIEHICKLLSVKQPHAMWIVVWREYGITDKVNRAIDSHAKRFLKETFFHLTNKYLQLTVIAGTVSTKKNYTYTTSTSLEANKKKLEYLTEQYKQLSWIKSVEAVKSKKKEQQQIVKEENAIASALVNTDQAFQVLRNTCYVFTSGCIWRHDKKMPMNEDEFNTDLSHAIFQPAHGKNNNTVCYLNHPIRQQVVVSFYIEICREHEFALMENNHKPLIHFLLSDTTHINLNRLHGHYAMQLDSITKPRLIVLDNDNSECTMQFYQHNVLKKEFTLVGPLALLVPFEKQVIQQLDSCLLYVKKEIRYVLVMIKSAFIKSCEEGFCYASDSIRCLEALLLEHQDIFVKHPIIDFFEAHNNERLKKTYVSLISLIHQQKERIEKHKDYLSIIDAPLLNK